MKKKGGLVTLKGKCQLNARTQLRIADGSFRTGYKVVDFVITPVQPVATYEYQAKITTLPAGSSFTGANWDWASNTEIAWTVWGVPSNNQVNQNTFIDPENMVIEDMFIELYASSDIGEANYQVVLQKYQFEAWDGAAFLVANQSQAVN
tara:strand:- start:46 stop:492 length:447 start_codon:yes stop_codon:yes gene_type:complete